MKKILIVAVASLALWSCKTAHNTQAPITEKKATPSVENKAIFNQVLKKADFQQVKINSKITAETGQFLPTLDATIYIEKDKKIWLNASALFLNVARGVATQQGIKAYEKWNKTYIESDFAYINKLLGVGFINYDALQNLLTGRAFVPIEEANFSIEKSDVGYLLKTKNPQSIMVEGKPMQYQMKLEYAPNFQLNRVVVDELSGDKNQLEVSYTQWENFGNTTLPKNVKIIIKGKKNSQISIENTKFDFNLMNAPYSVPSNYKKIEIK